MVFVIWRHLWLPKCKSRNLENFKFKTRTLRIEIQIQFLWNTNSYYLKFRKLLHFYWYQVPIKIWQFQVHKFCFRATFQSKPEFWAWIISWIAIAGHYKNFSSIRRGRHGGSNFILHSAQGQFPRVAQLCQKFKKLIL